MYRCGKCGKEFADEIALENDLLCTRKCGGKLTVFETAGDGAFSSLEHAIAEGKVVGGRWKVGKLIGEGGQAEVFLSEEKDSGRVGALKAVFWNLIHDKDLVKRFEHEAKLAILLDHPNIIKVFDVGQTPARQPFFVMEYMAGGTLADRLRSTPPDIGNALSIVEQILEALVVAHQSDVIHRDIKPENILFRSADNFKEVVLTDFGLAKTGLVSRMMSSASMRKMLGTARYMSPEQCQPDLNVDHRCDLYSLGVVLFQMCFGRVPFDSKDEGAIRALHISRKPTFPDQGVGGLPVPAEVRQILEKALCKSASDRFQSAGEFLEALPGWKTRTRIRTLLAKVQNSDRSANQEEVLVMLREVLSLDPGNPEANSLMKVRWEAALAEGKYDRCRELLPREPLGKVTVSSNPPGASILSRELPGRPTPWKTPIQDVPVKPGSFRLRIELEGHVPYEGEVSVTDGGTAKMEVSLRQVQPVSPPPAPKDAPAGDLQVEKVVPPSPAVENNPTNAFPDMKPSGEPEPASESPGGGFIGWMKGLFGFSSTASERASPPKPASRSHAGPSILGFPQEVPEDIGKTGMTQKRWESFLREAGNLLTGYTAGTGDGVKDVEELVRKEPMNVDLLDWLSFMYYSNDWFDSSMIAYQKLISLKPNSADAHFYLANTFFRLGKFPEAEKEWLEVMRLLPGKKLAGKAQDRIDFLRSYGLAGLTIPFRSDSVDLGKIREIVGERIFDSFDWEKSFKELGRSATDILKGKDIPSGSGFPATSGTRSPPLAAVSQSGVSSPTKSDADKLPVGDWYALIIDNQEVMRFAFVPGKDEWRQKFAPFIMGVFPVTQGQYQYLTGENPSNFQGDASMPVENVSWEEATEFCRELEKRVGRGSFWKRGSPDGQIQEFVAAWGLHPRLPREAEWEHACGPNPSFSFIDSLGSGNRTHPVGKLPPNAFGLYDMLGNVAHWCEDPYEAGSNRDLILPGAGASTVLYRMVRGGGWNDGVEKCRPSFRTALNPTFRRFNLGFRVVMEVPPQKKN